MTSKFALVIANTEYQDEGFSKLTAPGRDAEEFARVLKQPDLAAFDDVQVLLNRSEADTRRTIARFFTNRRPDDLLLLYFSGHGVRSEQGALFLAANDTEMGILEATGVPAEFVTRSMNSSRSQRQVLILDCCNSGAFDRGTKSASNMGMAQAFEGGFGRIVLTATDAVQFAWEGDKVIGDTQNSVFTHFLIQGLKGEAGRNSDGKISVDDLYEYAYEQVVKRTPKQTPSKWSYKQQGEIYLRENLKPREVKPAPLPQDLLDTLSYPSYIARKAGIQELQTFLNGANLGLKRSAEIKLREISANDSSLDLRKLAADILAEYDVGQASNLTPETKEKAESRIANPTYSAPDKKPARQTPITANLPKKEPPEPKPILIPGLTNKPQATRRVIKPTYLAIGGVVILAVLCLGFGVNYLINNLPLTSTPRTPATTEAPAVTEAPVTATEPPAASEAPALGIGSTTISEEDGMTMVFAPQGEFTMGSESYYDDEKPIHKVTLDAYWIDQTEVTNAMYAKCVAAGVCKEPSDKSSATHSSYYGNSEFGDYPVIYVDWNMAKTYCETWRGDKLPTEAEWEKAASWDDAAKTKRIYSWGDSIDCSYANYYDSKANKYCIGDTTKVGSYESGKSPYGLYDMAGNVWEWVSSLYKPYLYSTIDGREDLASSGSRVLRGGSWINYENNVRSTDRYGDTPDLINVNVGFRCARSAE
jgi:formylglycine-generating enzyme required for sulfatase activity